MMEKIIKFMVRYRIAGGFLLVLLYLYVSRPTPGTVASGMLVCLAGAALRTWASGHIRKGRELADTGPYSLVRNPLYLGSFFVGLGVCIMGNRAVFTILFIILFTVIYGRKMIDEEKHLGRKFGDEYEIYRASVPRIVPLLARPLPGRGFDWSLVLSHGEYQLWIGLLAVVLVFAAKAAV